MENKLVLLWWLQSSKLLHFRSPWNSPWPWNFKAKDQAKSKAKDLAFITKAKDFCAVLKDTSRPRPRTNIPAFWLLWPWPWPDDLHIMWTRPVYTPHVQIWTSCVKAFKSYRLTNMHTDRQDQTHAAARVVECFFVISAVKPWAIMMKFGMWFPEYLAQWAFQVTISSRHYSGVVEVFTSFCSKFIQETT